MKHIEESQMLNFYDRLHTCKPVESYMNHLNQLVEDNDIQGIKDLLKRTDDFSFLNHYNPLSYYKDKNLKNPLDIIYEKHEDSFEIFQLFLEYKFKLYNFITLHLNQISALANKGDIRYINYIIDNQPSLLTQLWTDPTHRDKTSFYPINHFFNIALAPEIKAKIIPLWTKEILLHHLKAPFEYTSQQKELFNDILTELQITFPQLVKDNRDLFFFVFSHSLTHAGFFKDLLKQVSKDFLKLKNSEGETFFHYFCRYEFDDLHHYKYTSSKKNELFNVYDKVTALFKCFPEHFFEILTTTDINNNTPLSVIMDNNRLFFSEFNSRMTPGYDYSSFDFNNTIINDRKETMAHYIIRTTSMNKVVNTLTLFNCDVDKYKNIYGKTPFDVYKEMNDNEPKKMQPLIIYHERRQLERLIKADENIQNEIKQKKRI